MDGIREPFDLTQQQAEMAPGAKFSHFRELNFPERDPYFVQDEHKPKTDEIRSSQEGAVGCVALSFFSGKHVRDKTGRQGDTARSRSPSPACSYNTVKFEETFREENPPKKPEERRNCCCALLEVVGKMVKKCFVKEDDSKRLLEAATSFGGMQGSRGREKGPDRKHGRDEYDVIF